MTRKKSWALFALVCLTIFVLLAAIKFFQIRAAIARGESFPEASETVEFHTTRWSQWQPKITVIGNVRASREIELRNELEGVIAEIGFESGGQVSSGEVLIQLDIAEEKAQLQGVLPEIDLAKIDVERFSALAARNAVSRQRSEQATTRLAVARAQRSTINEVIANKTVVAPFNGRAGLHDFEVGEFLSANQLITTLVGSLDALWIDFALPQQHTQISIGTKVEVISPDVANSIAEVIAVEPNISIRSRTLKARASLSNQQGLFTPGATVRLNIPVGDIQQVIRVPNFAIRNSSLGDSVFILVKDENGDWRAQRRAVQVRERLGDDSIINTGLNQGEIIATMGSFKLREGILVFQANQPSVKKERIDIKTEDSAQISTNAESDAR